VVEVVVQQAHVGAAERDGVADCVVERDGTDRFAAVLQALPARHEGRAARRRDPRDAAVIGGVADDRHLATRQDYEPPGAGEAGARKERVLQQHRCTTRADGGARRQDAQIDSGVGRIGPGDVRRLRRWVIRDQRRGATPIFRGVECDRRGRRRRSCEHRDPGQGGGEPSSERAEQRGATEHRANRPRSPANRTPLQMDAHVPLPSGRVHPPHRPGFAWRV
jgi:hypothetical protein